MKKTLYQIAWWKYLSIAIILYVLIAGFLVPLKPGIYNFTPRQAVEGESVIIHITGYNTHFSSGGQPAAWLKLPDDRLLKASSVDISDEINLEAEFKIPNTLFGITGTGLVTTLIVDNEKDGYAIYPQGFRIKKSQEDLSDNTETEEFHEINEIRQVDSFAFPFRNILYETIRNTFFHVSIWFAMFLLLLASCFYSIRYLRSNIYDDDLKSKSLTTVAIYFGIAGILTGSFWARFTWGTFWTSDIKLNMSAIALLIYFAYLILRKSISDVDARARISAVYNLFAFACLMILVMVIPRLTDSLHPGNGGNPALGGEDLDNTLRAVFYPAILGYTLIGLWMAQLFYRYHRLEENMKFKE